MSDETTEPTLRETIPGAVGGNTSLAMALAAIKRVRALHKPISNATAKEPWCNWCIDAIGQPVPYPCQALQTINAAIDAARQQS